MSDSGFAHAAGAAVPAAGPDWRRFAACRSADPELFFPVSASGPSLSQATKAKAICSACQVRRACLAFALTTRQAHGIWGGTSEEERRRGELAWTHC
jgi:WhiB family redox-sensing transcriptional regulator